ncbi:fatty-acyl-CoA synthase [Rhizobium aquaticum]|uniref:Fatty-acyl-CoA synthase n=1 Tax=Rhizobium aquaticum TaxID=1549636 RepID=A0ABV2J688_9HYPH
MTQTRHSAAALAGATSGPTIGTLFRDASRRHAANIAIRAGAARTSYADLNARVNQVADFLKGRGLGRGDRVAILSENRSEYLEIILACAKLGLIAACQNWRLLASELTHCISLVQPRILFSSQRYADIAMSLSSDTVERVTFGPAFEDCLDPASTGEPGDEVDPEDGLLILYTSGTTGLPKGALISHRAMIARGLAMMVDWSILPTDGCIAWSPFYHMASADPTLAAITQGGTISIVDGFDADAIVACLQEEACGWLVLMPGMMQRMIEALKASPRPVKRIAGAGCMANLVPPEQIAEVSRLLGSPFLNSFGSTETGAGPASASIFPSGFLPTQFGKHQSSLCQIRLVDENDMEVATGEIGEMCVRSPMLFSGYWSAPTVTEHEFRGGWFHTGDDFRRNHDGSLDYIDRRKYLIKSGGENIYPAEIELILKASNRVEEVAVVRQPDAVWGEIPVAFIVRRDPALSEDDVMALLDGRLARYKRPKRIIFISSEELVRNTTGKIQRNLLEDRLHEVEA